MSSSCSYAALVALALLAFPTSSAASAKPSYYVSLGDSWAQGVLRVHGVDRPTDRGFSDVLYRRLHRTRPNLKLVKLGCRAATTGSMIHGQKRCGVHVPYRGSQLAYAERFIRTHRIALVTVIIGGNEIWRCGCVGEIPRNLPTIARRLRRAAGPHTEIIGLTYANLLLSRGDRLFRDEVNPTMKAAYANHQIGFVDVTAAFGGPPELCRYAYVCDHPQDVHLNARGYAKLARAATRTPRERAAAPCSPGASPTRARAPGC